MPKVACLVPCYKRPEYTELCIKALVEAQDYPNVEFFLIDDGSGDRTKDILNEAPLTSTVFFYKQNQGLRNLIINFFELTRGNFDYLLKIDNDCLVPKNWLTDMIEVIKKTDYDILSPNVIPSNAAFGLGRPGEIVRPSDHVGGLWCMKADLIKDISFEKYSPNGITGAFRILKQIIEETEAKVGWVPSVCVQDIGHWSGNHPLHIKTKDHEEYSATVGRHVSWSATACL